MIRRKTFDKTLDQCWVSVPRWDHTTFNGMKNKHIRDELWNLYRDARKTRVRPVKRAKGVLRRELFYWFVGRAEYEWWDDGKKTNWFDIQDDDDWSQVVDGCKPLFELFEELEDGEA